MTSTGMTSNAEIIQIDASRILQIASLWIQVCDMVTWWIVTEDSPQFEPLLSQIGTMATNVQKATELYYRVIMLL